MEIRLTLAELCNQLKALGFSTEAYVAEAAFPQDSLWTVPMVRKAGRYSEMCWTESNIAGRIVSFARYHDGMYMDIIAVNSSPLKESTHFYKIPSDLKYHMDRISLGDAKGKDDCPVFVGVDVDPETLIGEIRKAIWDQPMANESGRKINADAFNVRWQKKDNRLHFFDLKNCEIFSSSPVVTCDRYANGYTLFITEDGHRYNLTIAN